MFYIPTKEKIADIFTKGLQRQIFDDFKLDMIDIYYSTWGGVYKGKKSKSIMGLLEKHVYSITSALLGKIISFLGGILFSLFFFSHCFVNIVEGSL